MGITKVKWFDGKKGYGFLLNPDGGEYVLRNGRDCSENALMQTTDMPFRILVVLMQAKISQLQVFRLVAASERGETSKPQAP